MEVRYKWLAGSRSHKVNAEVAAAELERIRNVYGELTPSLVLEESEPEDAPLHEEYEWDDSKAAHEFRLEQSRKIIRHVHVVRNTSEPVPVYVHVAVEDRNEGMYVPMETLVRNIDQYAVALDEAQVSLAAARARVTMLLMLRETAPAPQLALRSIEEAEDALTNGNHVAAD